MNNDIKKTAVVVLGFTVIAFIIVVVILWNDSKSEPANTHDEALAKSDLFFTPIDVVDPYPVDDPEITSPEDDIVSLPVHVPAPLPEPVPDRPALPLEVSSIQIWVPNSHRVEDFNRSISREGPIELSARIEPPGIDVEVTWETDRPDVIEWTFVVGGIRVVPLAEGDAWLTVTAGDKEGRCIIRVIP
jgi:hypothetical protein